MKLSPTVLITNVHSSLNAGDLALVQLACSQLRQVFQDPKLFISANWPEENYFADAHNRFTTIPSPWHIVGRTQGVSTPVQIIRTLNGMWLARMRSKMVSASGNSENADPWQALFTAYEKADFVVGVSGNQFYSTGKFGWPMPVNAMGVALAHVFKKPFYTFPQTIGPIKREWERGLLRALYGRARGLFFRERNSVKLAQKIGIPADKCHYAPDPAFAYPAASRTEALEILSRYGYVEGEDCLGLTIIAHMGRSLQRGQVENYYRTIAGLLFKVVRQLGIKVYIFNQVTGPTEQEDDRVAVRRVFDQLGEPLDELIWVNETLSPGQLKACFGCMQLFIASRLHSGIFATGAGVPTLFINYLTKTRGVMEAAGLEEWVIDLTAIEEQPLYETVCQAWADRQDRTRHLVEDVLPGLYTQIDRSIEWIAHDYAAWQKNPRPSTN